MKKKELLIKKIKNKKEILDKTEINLFTLKAEDLKQNKEEKYEKLNEVDSRNKLNNLLGKEWLPETKSYFFQKGLGSKHPHAKIEIMHPAPFSFQDISRLITFFTKRGQEILDPFGGVGSTAKACEIEQRRCTSIELSERWHHLAIERLESEVGTGASTKHNFINGDSKIELKKFDDQTFDFIVTSPPYWSILNKKADHKVKNTRLKKELATNYSNQDTSDLSNIENYDEFKNILVNEIFLQCARVLKLNKYMCIIVSDFRNKSEFISFHSDLIQSLNKREIDNQTLLVIQGVKILIQNHKSLLPYGYPFSYVENIHHQYVLVFRKIKR
jgi:DNA modification methylase